MYLFNQPISSYPVAVCTGVFLLTLANSSFALQGASFKSYDSATVKSIAPVKKQMTRIRKPVVKAKPMAKLSPLSADSVRSGSGSVIKGIASKAKGIGMKPAPRGTGKINFMVASSTGIVFNQRRAIAHENHIDHSSINIVRKDVEGVRVIAKAKKASRAMKPMASSKPASNKMKGFKFNNYDSPVVKAKPKMMHKKVMAKKVEPVVEAPASKMIGFSFRKF